MHEYNLQLQCDRTISPESISDLRSKVSAVEQRKEIAEEELKKKEKNTLKTYYGLRDEKNSMYDLSVDLFR